LVGFGIEEKTNWRHWHPRPFWKIKNSWGPNWGEGMILSILFQAIYSRLRPGKS